MVEKFKSRVRYHGLYAAPLLCVLLLCGMVTEKVAMRVQMVDADDYLQRIRLMAAQMPKVIGDWVGTDVPMPAAAISTHQPNVAISRHFVNIRTGEQAGVLLVQCSDRRGLLGYFPPVFYPGQGWRITSDNDWNVRVKDVTIPAKWYKLVKPGTDKAERMIVGNFMIVPDGRLVRDMTGVNSHSATKSHNLFGAAQMQVVVHGYLTANTRDEIFRELVTGHLSLIQAIEAGEE